jgi:hypothetical protein
MTKARILADYVAGGTTAAEFDYMDGVTSNVQTQMDLKAPLASPTLVTPALGTPASGVVTNLSGVLPVGVTGGSGLTALGTVTAGTYNATIGGSATFPTDHIIQVQTAIYATQTTVAQTSFSASGTIGISGSITPSSTSNNILIFLNIPFKIERSTTAVRCGFRIYRSASGSTDGYLDNNATGSHSISMDNSGTDGAVLKTFHTMNEIDTAHNTSGSAVTYTVHAAFDQTANSQELTVQEDNIATTMILMEKQA